ncbi:SirA family protein [Acidimicrobium ferrooxidans DSM 10331]|uniref:SirA family protein n=1 Tax=Acidimicrobium ferrooxidans (strain DSM 10331 / JCM 15462 / NBRC 103882 / ICP) TaxID=525909 RepID=C7M020_ACIFD|nr:sulfurtransferase TusA family protein [Acidimicrobium ferrooxidans]ACU54328.1 SirA family protein [Acidimicrobium ferrooxidans DSM 10331]
MTEQPSEQTTRTIVDSRGSACPGPITDLALAYRKAKVGDEIELLATDPGVKADVTAWAAKTHNEVLAIEEGVDGVITTRIKIVSR